MRQTDVFRTLVVALVTITVSSTSVGAQESSAPYIHYFSRIHQGLIIERADGTDSRLLEGVSAGDVHWSPTGAWFTVDDVAIHSTDGTRQAEYPQSDGSYRYLQWAPQDDVLLVVGTPGLDGSIRSQIYEVDTETVLADLVVQYWGFDPAFPITLHWSADGQKAFVFWTNHLVTLDRNGQAHLRVHTSFPNSHHYSPFLFHQGLLLTTLQVELARSAIAIQDLETGQWREIEDGKGFPGNAVIIRWSPTRNHALLYAPDCADATCEHSLRLLNWHTGEMVTLTPTVPLPPGDIYCHQNYNHICSSVWSLDGRYAVLTNIDSTIHVINALTGETEALDISASYYEWLSGSELLIHSSEIQVFDADTRQGATIDFTFEYLPFDFSPSPDGTLIGIASEPPAIIDLSGNIVAMTIPHSHSTAATRFPQYGYKWSPDGTWAMADYNISISGGGVGPSASVLFSLEGATRRELPSGGHAGFVPARAGQYLGAGQTRSFKVDPIYILPQQGLIGVGWHPTDPNQLVTYSLEAGLIFWSLANGVEVTDQRSPEVPYPPQGPYGLRLLWLPDQDSVAFFGREGIFRMDSQSGEAVLIEDIDYPRLVLSLEDISIRYSQSNVLIPFMLTSRNAWFLLFSDLRTFIVTNDIGIEPIYLIETSENRQIQLDIDSVPWTGDARDNIAALGSVYDCCIQVLNIETGETIGTFYGTAYSLALSADGRRLATSSRGMTAIWDMTPYVDSD